MNHAVKALLANCEVLGECQPKPQHDDDGYADTNRQPLFFLFSLFLLV